MYSNKLVLLYHILAGLRKEQQAILHSPVHPYLVQIFSEPIRHSS